MEHARHDDVPHPVPRERMAEHVRAGEAVPLLDTNASPVLFRGEWWAVTADSPGREYLPVRDFAGIELLDASAIRLGWTPPP